MDVLLIAVLFASFFITLFMTPWWIIHAKKSGIVGRDMHKDAKKVAEMGGINVIIGLVFGLLLFVGHRTFFQGISDYNAIILGVVSTVLLVTMIGMIDDLLGWKIGLRQYMKPILILFGALPMMMINAGISKISVPVLGMIDLGFFYPLVLIPIAITCASNGFNMIGGYNGLEAGMGIIILGTLGFIAWAYQGSGVVAMIAFAAVFSLVAFLLFNFYPAKVFPGNTLTFPIGALIAIVAILGNVEKAAVVLFIPYFFEFFLKARGGWQKESFADVGEKGLFVKKIYGLEHLMVRLIGRFKDVTERDVVLALWAMEGAIALVVLGFVFV